MSEPADRHNAAILPLLRLITENAGTEAQQWVIIETLCLGIGKLHRREARQIAEFVEAVAERIATGARS